jgi:hypothetical protein
MRRTAQLKLVILTTVLLLVSNTGRAAAYDGLVGTTTDFDFFVRESFRGDEVDDRNFEYDAEYFLNVLSFRHLTSADEVWTAHRQGYRLALGSVTNDEFFLDQEVKADAQLGTPLTLHYRFVQAEDYGSRYVRNLVGLSVRVSNVLSVYGFTQLNGFKEDIDVGGGLLVTTKPVQINLGVVFPQAFLNTKSQDDASFEEQAVGLGAVVRVALQPRWSLAVRIFQQLPLELRQPQEELTFEFRRLVFGARLTYRINPTSMLSWRLDGEDTEKQRRFSERMRQDDAQLTRFALRSTLVYTRTWQHGHVLDVGVFVHRLDEPTRFANTPFRSVDRERTEVLFFGQFAWRVWDDLFVVPAFFGGVVNAVDHRPTSVLPDRGGDSVQAKLNLGVAYHLSDRAQLRLQATFDLDQQRFGGAGAVLVATF